MIYLGLGGNLGDREAQLSTACDALVRAGIEVIARSSFHETAALLPENAPEDWDKPFLNQVIAVQTDIAPAALLALLKETEQALGRQDRGRWSPREIDIDIIAYHDEVLESDSLTIPHAQMDKRAFVLLPLQEIAPDWVHPVSKKSIHALVSAL